MMRNILTLLFLLFGGAAYGADCSGTIATGGTAQTVANINASTKALMLMNNSANLMCVSFTGAVATIAGTNCGSGSWTLQPGSATAAGGSFLSPPNLNISVLSIISASTGDRYSCERQ